MKLSICVVTMNRAEQLKEALESCLSCELPKSTEFVVVDNASTDNTEVIVKELFKKQDCSLLYEKMGTNIGAGAGRNKYYEMASGDYIYGMDDDAIIDTTESKLFFIRALEILDEHKDIAALGTQIYDEAWKANRQSITGMKIYPGIYHCKMFCGGSHFLRHSFYKEPPYFPNKYGYEELPPSLMAFDRSAIVAFAPALNVIHKPRINKWNFTDDKNFELLIHECAIQYAIKKQMYPCLALPLLKLSYEVRCKKHLSHIANGKRKADAAVKETVNQYPIDYKIKFSTVLRMYKDFGISIF